MCMEHPHNAVLLVCSSHDKGCRPYMCDTSHRHSNCLDQFCKAFSAAASCPENNGGDDPEQSPAKMACPLCRGAVVDWIAAEPARRRYMNGKARVCSLETCAFSGTYGELRKHARTEHPSVRPSDVDPERQRTWRRMERQRDIEDLLSSIRPLFADGEMAVAGNDVDVEVVDSRGVIVYLMIVRVQPQEEVGAASTRPRPQVLVTFGPRSGPASGRRRRSRVQLAEGAEGGDPIPVVVQDDGGAGGAEEDMPQLGSSSPPHTGRRRRFRMDEDDI